MRPPSILVISPAPDERWSTAELGELAARLDDAGAATVVWYLRAGDAPVDLAVPSRVVDSLRTWRPVEALARIGAERAAAGLAGLALRTWRWRLGRIRLVILDDGVGGRVLGRRHPPVMVRRNDPPSTDLGLEEPWSGPTLLTITTAPGVLDVAGDVLREPPLRHARPTEPALPAAAARRLLGIAPDGRVVAWCAGPTAERGIGTALELVRRLERDRAIEAHLLVAVPSSDPARLAEVREAAAAAGLAERVHARVVDLRAIRHCADVVVAASPLPPDATVELALSGVGLSGPSPAPFGDDLVRPARLDDPVALARAVADLLAEERSRRAQRAAQRLDPDRFASALLGRAGISSAAPPRSLRGGRPRRPRA